DGRMKRRSPRVRHLARDTCSVSCVSRGAPHAGGQTTSNSVRPRLAWRLLGSLRGQSRKENNCSHPPRSARIAGPRSNILGFALTRACHRPKFVTLEGRPETGLRRRRAEPFEPDPGHAGEGTEAAVFLHPLSPPSADAPQRARRTAMNEIPKFAAPHDVTTGPIAGSRKVYASPKGRADIRVPFREIALSDPKEPPVRVYDPSGPYTESAARIDLAWGLPSVRESWIASRGYAAIEGRSIRPEDNGAVSADRLAPLCPATRTLRAGSPGQFITQCEFARAGVITEEMIYVAHRENLAREAAVDEASARIADGESFGAE